MLGEVGDVGWGRRGGAPVGVGVHGETQAGQDHQHAGGVQQGLTSGPVHQTGCYGDREQADDSDDDCGDPERRTTTVSLLSL